MSSDLEIKSRNDTCSITCYEKSSMPFRKNYALKAKFEPCVAPCITMLGTRPRIILRLELIENRVQFRAALTMH